MARGQFYHDPARKHISQFQDFSGGLNTTSSNDNVKDNELVRLENVNLGDRGSLTRRKGYDSTDIIDADGLPQMYTRLNRRLVPYNMLGMEGSFDGLKTIVGKDTTIGGWYAFNMVDEANAYKVDRGESEDLIYNGNFDLGEDGWHLNVDGITVGTSSMGKSVYAEEGDNVLRLKVHKYITSWNNEYQSKILSVTKGEKIKASVRYRRAALSMGVTPYRVHLICSLYFTDDRPTERIYIKKYDVSNKWQLLEGTFTIPSGVKSIKLGLGMFDNNLDEQTAVYFEEFKAYREPSKMNLVINGDFTNGDNGWNLNASDTQGMESIVGDSSVAYVGDQVLRLTIHPEAEGILNEYQTQSFDTFTGDVFDATAMYRQAAQIDRFGVVPYRAHIVASVRFLNGSTKRYYKGGYSADYTWRKINNKFVMPRGARTVLFGLGMYDPNNQKKGKILSIYFGQLKVTRQEQLIVNGAFERGEEGWDLNIEDRIVGDSVVDNSAVSHTGSKVLRIRRYSHNGGFYNEYQSNNKRIKVREGDEIYAEVYYRQAAKSLGVAPYRVHLIASIKFKDGTSKREYIRKYDANAIWKKMSGYFKMPKNAVSVLFGVGLFDMTTEGDCAAYFDTIYARRQIEGSENSVLAIRSDIGDPHIKRGLGYKFQGLESNKYYVMAVDYKSDGVGTGAIAVRDERFGVYPNDNGVILEKTFTDSSEKWVTKYMKFKTYDGMGDARAYVYNQAPIGTLSTVYYDDARIYELKTDEYNLIDEDPEYTGELLGSKFPYRVGKLTSETITEDIVASGGKFYINGVEKKVEKDTPIQTERMIESVEFQNNLYIATGSGLFVYNGSTIAEVSPYDPDSLETLYIGSNGLLANPYYIGDKEQSVVEIKKVKFSRRYGVTNKDITLMVGVNKPGGTNLEYKFERRNVRDKEDYWFTMRDWGSASGVTFKTDIAGEYQFRFSVRKFGEELVLEEFIIPKYIIKPTDDQEDVPIDSNTIHLCNRVFIHWNRLIMYGDEAKEDVIYISDLYNPSYFPVNNTLQFVNPRKERITSITNYRNNLVIFTKSSIQALFGTSPEDYERVMLNTDVGCIADRAVSVVQDQIIFLSYEGIMILKTVGQSESKANVRLIDDKVRNLVHLDIDAVTFVRKNQLHMVFPSRKTMLRYYYEWGVWVHDNSDSLDFNIAFVQDDEIYALGSNSRVIRGSDSHADDGVPFDAIIGTKMYNFNEPYSLKKVRQLQLMFDNVQHATQAESTIYVDYQYHGQYTEATIDFEYEHTLDSSMHMWETEITPSHTKTIKKHFASDKFGETETISKFAKRKNAFMVFAGSNGTEGLQVYENVTYQETSDNQAFADSLAIKNDGTLEVVTPATLTDNVLHTFHSGPVLVSSSTVRSDLPTTEEYTTAKPRQGIGQKVDGTLVILTIGRTDPESVQGATIAEFATMFLDRGCVIAYNLSNSEAVQGYVDGNLLDVYSDGKERRMNDFIYFSKDVVNMLEGNKEGVIATETINLTSEDDVYKVTSPGKGLTVGSTLVHSEDKPLKLVGLSHVFKLKKP